LRVPLAALWLLLLIPFHLAPLYYKSYLSEEHVFGIGGGMSGVRIVPRGAPLSMRPDTFSGYMLLNAGDKVSFDVTVSSTGARATWSMSLEILDLASGERWVFNGTYYTPKGLTPEFIAPYTGFYRYTLRVKVESLDFYDGGAVITIAPVVSGRSSPRDGVRTAIAFEALALVAIAALLAVVASRSRLGELLAYKGFVGQVRWELRGMYFWALFPLTVLAYTVFVLNFNSEIDSYSVVLEPVRLRGAPEFYVFYAILVSIAVTMLFAYRLETGYDKPIEILPRSRIQLFAAKLSAVALVTIAPIALASLNTYVVWQGRLLASMPLEVLKMWFYETLFLLALTMAIASIPLVLSILLPYTGAVLALSLVVLLAIYIDNPVKEAIGFDMRSFIVTSETPILSLYRPVGPWETVEVLQLSGSYLRFLEASAALGLASIALSLTLYVRRESS